MIAVYSSLIDVFVIVLVIGQIISLNLSERILKWCRCWEITSLFLYSQLKSSAIFARTNCEYFSPNNWAAAELQRANKVILNLRTTKQFCKVVSWSRANLTLWNHWYKVKQSSSQVTFDWKRYLSLFLLILVLYTWGTSVPDKSCWTER